MKTDRLLATGDQVEVTAGDARLVVVTMGGGLRELVVGDRPVLDGFGADEVPPGAAGQPLIPWPNRLADGRYAFAGHDYQVPLTEPDKHNALHGFARWMTWRVERHEHNRATLGLEMFPRAGYPFALRIEVDYTLTGDSLSVATTACNAGGSSLPYANGFHPYITVGLPIDECTLQMPGATLYETDERQIPTGRRAVKGTPFDFRKPRVIGASRVDTAFTDLTRDADGRARVRLASGDGERQVTVWLDETYPYLMIFTGDTLPDTARRRRSLGVEPMTSAPNAFQSGDGLRILEPGQSVRTEWGIEF